MKDHWWIIHFILVDSFFIFLFITSYFISFSLLVFININHFYFFFLEFLHKSIVFVYLENLSADFLNCIRNISSFILQSFHAWFPLEFYRILWKFIKTWVLNISGYIIIMRNVRKNIIILIGQILHLCWLSSSFHSKKSYCGICRDWRKIWEKLNRLFLFIHILFLKKKTQWKTYQIC